MTIALHIEPLDTLFFRDSRPFTAGDDVFAESTLPSPLTLYGAVGSYHLDSRNCTLKDFINGFKGTELGKYLGDIKGSIFKIKGPFLCFDRVPYFPAPSNLWLCGKLPLILKPYEDVKGKRSDLGDLSPVAFNWEGEIEPSKGYINQDDLQIFLSGGKTPWGLNLRFDSDFFLKEEKVGHQIRATTRTVKEGMLYSLRHLRFRDTTQDQLRYKKTTLLVITDSLKTSDFQEKTYCIGGERRGVVFTASEISTKLIPEDKTALDKICTSKRFCIYLATPAIFKQGWHPSDFDGAKMVGAAVNKPQYISGWIRSGDGARGKPREIKRLVPAGSVYFFKADTWDNCKFEEIYKKYHFGESISDEYPDAGFGIGLLGVW